MANASKTHFGKGAQGKQSGTGAMTNLPEGLVEDNRVLSNRDKALHSAERGMDGRYVQLEQHQEEQQPLEGEGEASPAAQPGDSSGVAGPMSDASAAESSRKEASGLG